MELIYKIITVSHWRDAKEIGSFAGMETDLVDGFMHFSTAGQIRETAAKHFKGQDGLMLIAASRNLLSEALRFEPSRGGALFPHLYGSLPLDAVAWAMALRPLPDGGFDFSFLLEE
ncbi:MAG: DUF952 domain-containing protein [Beijerinckiaceae bacterium]|nr:DUF952 domain-containing protein [Beijerinckiaceae bacterium]MCI0598706.1 DUF952 domain-containing protein [Beijerinckiaceae bacterium]MCI0735360.1 DUF952 domain-containing protein [Beijerinckiaceae bacterium]